MDVNYQSLRSRFEEKDSEELIEKYNSQELTELANQVIADILQERQVNFTPKAPEDSHNEQKPAPPSKIKYWVLGIVSCALSLSITLIKWHENKAETEARTYHAQEANELNHFIHNTDWDNLDMDNLLQSHNLTASERIMFSQAIQKQVSELNKLLPKESVEGFLRLDKIDVNLKEHRYIQNYTVLDTESYDVDSSLNKLVKTHYCSNEAKLGKLLSLDIIDVEELGMLYRFQDTNNVIIKEILSTSIRCEDTTQH